MIPAEGPMPLRPLPGYAGRAEEGDPGLLSPTYEDRRARILAATASAIAADGYHGATLEAIVRDAKVGWRVFYRHFADKQAAFLALLEETYAAGLARMHEAAAHPGPQPHLADPELWPCQVAAALRDFFAQIATHPDRSRACLVEALTAGPQAVARYERALQQAGTILLPGRRLGDGAADLAPTLEDTLAGGVAWIAYQRLVQGQADEVPALLPEALDFLIRPYLGEQRTAEAVARWGGKTYSPSAPPTGGPLGE